MLEHVCREQRGVNADWRQTYLALTGITDHAFLLLEGYALLKVCSAASSAAQHSMSHPGSKGPWHLFFLRANGQKPHVLRFLRQHSLRTADCSDRLLGPGLLIELGHTAVPSLSGCRMTSGLHLCSAFDAAVHGHCRQGQEATEKSLMTTVWSPSFFISLSSHPSCY